MSRSLVHIPRNHGVMSNLDIKIDKTELSRSMKLEAHMSVYEDYLSSGAAGDGTYGYQGDHTGGRMTVPKDVTGGGMSKAQRVARVNLRMNSGEPPLLVSIDPKSGIKIFAEEDKEAFEDGYICERCVQYQAVPHAPACNWRNNSSDGCGRRNY